MLIHLPIGMHGISYPLYGRSRIRDKVLTKYGMSASIDHPLPPLASRRIEVNQIEFPHESRSVVLQIGSNIGQTILYLYLGE